MGQLRATAERRIAAPAERVYRAIADFANEHQRFLPPAFSDYQVEQGGFGAGTIISYRLTLGGRTRLFRTEAKEPLSGRVLTESDTRSSMVTTYTVTPAGEDCRARIETTWQGGSGFGGLVERIAAPLGLRRLYGDELRRLGEYVRSEDRAA